MLDFLKRGAGGRNILALGVVSFFNDVSSEMIFSALPLFLTAVLGVSAGVVGLIEGIADSASAVTEIISGYFSDKLGRRKDFVILGYGFSSLTKIGFVFASSWPVVLVLRGLERLGKGIRTSPRDAIIASSTTKAVRGAAFGLHRAMDTAGAVAGPLVAYFVLKQFGSALPGYKTLFAIAVVPALVAVACIVLFVREPSKDGWRKASAHRSFWDSLKGASMHYKRFLYTSVFFSLAYFSFAFLLLRAFSMGISAADVLLLYAFYNVVYALVSVPIGSLSDRIGRKIVIAGSFALYAVICVGFVLANSWQLAVALFAAYGVFVSTDESVNKAFISDISKENSRATMIGLYNTAVAVAYLPASIAAGALWTMFGPALTFGLAAAIAVISSFAILFLV